MKIIYQADENYPKMLGKIYAPPTKLYLLGNEKILNNTSIAMVGCRKSSKYGEKVAFQLAYELAKRGIVIVSGLARGIDSYSHLGAIKAKGKTIAVLGSGFNNIYPKENKKLCEDILKYNGAIITEYSPEKKPLKMHFPARNRIIRGITLGVVVIEAKEKSGTMITVDYALDQGREVFAVPREYYK